MAPLAYPAPSLVIGMGRFGLGVLERMGEDFQQLRLAGEDLSLGNLRLVWVTPEDESEDCWRQRELDKLAVARHIEDGDMPSIVLDFVVLRSLGLIRYRHGGYQVAVPQDRGAIRTRDLPADPEAETAAEAGSGDEPEEAAPPRKDEADALVRRRFFDWIDLHPDPLRAAEELRRVAERQAALDLFIAPLINRIRQGDSPRVLLTVIQRCRLLATGRDPSPWAWVQEAVEGDSISQQTIEKAREPFRRHDRLLDRLAAPPLKLKAAGGDGLLPADMAGGEWEFADQSISIPAPLQPQPGEPKTPIDPFHLLSENWQATGWVTDLGQQGKIDFAPLEVSPFRLGLFDHSPDRAGVDEEHADKLGDRLRSAALHLHRGLTRLWGDLRRESVEERSPLPGLQRHPTLDGALQQSLEMLERLVVKPLQQDDWVKKKAAAQARDLHCPNDLPAAPTRFLDSLRMEPDPHAWRGAALERRLASLGLSSGDLPTLRGRRLLTKVRLSADPTALPAGADRGGGEPGLRKCLNREVRELLDVSFLSEYRQRPTRNPPRLTVFVVGDMSEPFTRLEMTSVLQDIHAELLRAFSSLFELNRAGFDRSLSVVPILWMPHPADPFSGDELERTRLEEAVVIDAVHRVRRWVESVLPGARRRISQIFINSRVTDNAVLTAKDCIQQTRDFLAFQIRNDLARDDWLRRTAVGPGGDDYFASFACREIEFPAERAREYLANRLARACLHRLRDGQVVAPPASPPLPELSAPESLVGGSHHRLWQETEERGDELSRAVQGALPDGDAGLLCTPRREILSRFDEAFERRLWQRVTDLWQELTTRQGRVDDAVDRLRQQTSLELGSALTEIRRDSDDEIAQTGARGLPAVMAYLGDRRRGAHDLLQEAEGERQEGESDCARHLQPRRAALRSAREAVQEAARRKPDCGPLWVGLGLWAALTPATAVFVGVLFQQWLQRWALPAGSLLLVATAALGLWTFARRRQRSLRQRILAMAEGARRLVAGDGGDPRREEPSLRSFLETRLRLTWLLARRGFATHVFEQSAADEKLGLRLRESVDIQEHRMARRAESLGVRPAPPGAEEMDDLRGLFLRRSGRGDAKLIHGDHLVDYYRSRVRDGDLPILDLLEAGGGLREWRRLACLSDSKALMRYCRSLFSDVVNQPITELDYFAPAVGRRLREFVSRNYSTQGFGAKFLGYEGLDPDGVRLVADAALVADQPLLNAYRRAEELEEEQGTTEGSWRRPKTLEFLDQAVRPNAAYMLSLVQGIRAHSVRNLRRFESFHDRPEEGEKAAIHRFSGYEPWAESFFEDVNRVARRTAAEAGPEGSTEEASETSATISDSAAQEVDDGGA